MNLHKKYKNKKSQNYCQMFFPKKKKKDKFSPPARPKIIQNFKI